MMETMEKDAQSLLQSPRFDKPLRVCFVCMGNTCRSPMAAAVLNDMARIPPVCTMCDLERSLGMRPMIAASAGLCTGGEPIAPNAVSALEEAGIKSLPDNDYKSHRAVQIEAEMLEKCDRIVCVKSALMLQLVAMYPQYTTKITCMPNDIGDPFGGDLAEYRACLARIREGIEEMFFEGEPI